MRLGTHAAKIAIQRSAHFIAVARCYVFTASGPKTDLLQSKSCNAIQIDAVYRCPNTFRVVTAESIMLSAPVRLHRLIFGYLVSDAAPNAWFLCLWAGTIVSRHQQDHLQSGSEEKRQPLSRLGLKSIEHFLGLHPAIRPPMQSDETLSVSPHRFLPGILTSYVPSKGSSET